MLNSECHIIRVLGINLVELLTDFFMIKFMIGFITLVQLYIQIIVKIFCKSALWMALYLYLSMESTAIQVILLLEYLEFLLIKLIFSYQRLCFN